LCRYEKRSFCSAFTPLGKSLDRFIGGIVLQKLLLLAAAGSLGTVARYGLASSVKKIDGVPFFWGTMTVNIVGCLVVGFLWALFEDRWQVSEQTRVIVLVGFMGAFTTFSAFILETGELVRSADWLVAAGNVAIQNGLGFGALFAGVALGRMV
jgi:CrcB protein